MADEIKVMTYMGGLSINQRKFNGCFTDGPPPTFVEKVVDGARTVGIYTMVGLLIFGGSYAATKNPEAFMRGFVSGLVGYAIVRGAR